MALSSAATLVLDAAKDDWVPLSTAVHLIRHNHPPRAPTSMREATISALKELFADGLIRGGDVTDDGFVAWPGNANEHVARIEREWDLLGREPVLGEIGWVAVSKEELDDGDG
jgi:hypothetical protein